MRSHAKASSAASTMRRAASLGRVVVAPLTFVALLFLALAPAATAAPTRSYSSSFGSFGSGNPQALTVDQSTGDVYAVDTATSSVDRFDSAGNPKNFTAGTDANTNTLAGITFGLIGEGEVAIDTSGGAAAGAVYVTNVNGSIKVYKTDGTSLGTLTGTGTPAGSFASACGVAVDQATGDLYVADATAHRIWRYSPSGSTVAESDYSGGIETSFAPCQLAADSGNVYATPQGLAGGELTRFRAEAFAIGTPPAPSGAVIDATTRAVSVNPLSGDVYADKGGEIAVYQSGTPAGGAPYYTFGSSADFATSSQGVAVKAGGPAYVADRHTGGRQIDVYGPEVTGFPLTVQKTGTGIGTVTSSPAGIDCGLTCVATLGGTVTLTATPASGSGFKSWSGCGSVAGNQCTVTMNAAKTVTASFSSTPLISATEATQIGVHSVKLGAQLNPGGEPTNWHFEYVDDAGFQANGFANATRAPVPSAFAGSGSANAPVSVAVSGLAATTTYHFRLVATNALGTQEGSEVLFTTYAEAPGFESCVNDAFRTGPGARLPDCRAYEQATPVDKNGSDAGGNQKIVDVSSNGDAVTFMVLGGAPGGVGSQRIPVYIARRGASNWSTQGLMPPAALGDSARIRGWTPDLTHSFSTVKKSAGGLFNAFVDQDTAAASFQLLTPYSPEKGESFPVGTSADGSIVYFENDNSQLTPDAAPEIDNVYAWDRATGAVSLVGKVPAGSDTECGAGGPACVVDPRGSTSYANSSGARSGQQGIYTERMHSVSTNGEQVVFNAGPTEQLYARRDATGPNASTVQISASQRTDCASHDPCNGTPEPDPVGKAPAAFRQATPSGSKVLFTSSEELTNDANTGPPFLPSYIGRADVADGGNADPGFIPNQKASGLEVNGNFLYWVDSEEGKIGRADISDADCSPDPAPCHVNPAFITGADNPKRVAFYLGQIYWTNSANGEKDEGSIGRADLPSNISDSAENVNQNYIDTTVQVVWKHEGSFEPFYSWDPSGIAFDSSGKLYWGNLDSEGGPVNAALIRANADGSDPAIWGKAFNCPTCGIITWTPSATDIEIEGTDIYVTSRHLDSQSVGVQRMSTTDEFIREQNIFFESSPDASTDGVAVDGSHVYWNDSSTGTIGRANRDGTDASNTFLSGVDSAAGVAVDGSNIYYSSLVDASKNPGADLYSWDSSSHQLTDLAPDSSDENGAEVKGVVGASDDGSYVYFVANGDLDGPGPATLGDCQKFAVGEFAYTGQCNLYLWHEGDPIKFIARQSTFAGGNGDVANWTRSPYDSFSTFARSGFVSADGRTVLFRSSLQQTAYDNHGLSELYRWQVGDPAPTCVSCIPTGAAPGASATISSISPAGAISPIIDSMPEDRALSVDGEQAFFETRDKLVASDVNGKQDVYEWEAPGAGACSASSSAYSAQDGGCLYLISTGTSSDPSYFAGSSESGKDVFFFTRDQLVPQDTDQLIDVYDARVEGGLPAQHAVALPSCAGEACRGAGSSSPSGSGAGTAAFSGPGNEAQEKAPLRNCSPAARQAQSLARASKKLRLRARNASDPALSIRLRRRSALLAKRAHRLSRNAKRCRSANRRAAR